MPRNAQGVYSLPTGNPVVSNTLITSVWANTTMADLANEITASLPRNGTANMTGPLILAGDATANLQAVTKQQLDSDISDINSAISDIDVVIDGLGTASAETVTTSQTDTTHGRVLRIGDLGIGADSDHALMLSSGDDLDDINFTSMHVTREITQLTNAPVGAITGGWIQTVVIHDTEICQIFQEVNTVMRQWRRAYISPLWGGWSGPF